MTDISIEARGTLSNDQYERMVLGACLVSVEAVEIASVNLQDSDFYLDAHKAVFRLCKKIIESGHPLGIDTVINAFKVSGTIDRVGGAVYLLGLCDSFCPNGHIEYYCRELRNLSTRRRLIETASHIQSLAIDHERDISTILADCDDALYACSDQAQGIQPWRDACDEAWKSLYMPPRAVRPFLNALANADVSWPDSEPTVIAGMSGSGKSHFLLEQTRYLCKAGIGVLGVSLEMSTRKMHHLLLAMEVGVNIKSLRRGIANGVSWSVDGTLEAARERIAEWPLTLVWMPTATVSEISAVVRVTRRQMERDGKRLGLCWTDYIQLLDAPHGAGKGYEATRATARAYMAEVGRYGIATLLASQLTVDDAKGADDFPDVHTAEGRVWENNAGCIVYIHRPCKDGKGKTMAQREDPNRVLIKVAKARDGGEGLHECGWRVGPGGFVDREGT